VIDDRKIYKPGENVTLQLKASPHKGARTNEPAELAVVVLDESVFDLIQEGRSYFDIYRGFYQLDGLDLTNFGLLTRQRSLVLPALYVLLCLDWRKAREFDDDVRERRRQRASEYAGFAR